MGQNRQNAEQRRLARVRALKEQHFPGTSELEDQLKAKDRRIAELEREVEILQLRLSRTRAKPETSAPKQRRQHGVY